MNIRASPDDLLTEQDGSVYNRTLLLALLIVIRLVLANLVSFVSSPIMNPAPKTPDPSTMTAAAIVPKFFKFFKKI